MLTFLYIFAKIVSITLVVITYAMLARMLLPLVVNPDDSTVYRFSVGLSEPIVAPVRYLMAKFNFLSDTPLDFSLPVAYILLFIVRLLLPSI